MGLKIATAQKHICKVVAFKPSYLAIGAKISQVGLWSLDSKIGVYSKSNHIFLVDLKANVRIIDGLQFSLGAYNIFDYNYYLNAGEYMPGRRIFVSLEYKY